MLPEIDPIIVLFAALILSAFAVAFGVGLAYWLVSKIWDRVII